MNAGLACIMKIGKEQTIRFHGKTPETTGKVVNKLVSFLEEKLNMTAAEGGGITEGKGRTPTKVDYNGPVNLEGASNIQPALKHSCPQKNEPAIPSLHAMRLRNRRREVGSDLAQVGHSNLDEGFPLIQLEL